MNKSLIKPLVALGAIIAFLYVGVWKWGMSRVYVGPDEILVITSKFGGDNLRPDQDRVVADGVKGIWKDVRGEGRHFFSPIEYSVDTKSEVVEIEDGQVGLVESLSGESLPQGEFIVHRGKNQKGIEEEVLTPGKWRRNPFAFKITPIPATMIRPGYVGVVTRQTGEFPGEGQLAEKGQRGIQKNVLQPGIYYLNPRVDKVEEIWVGYNEITLESVTFPSKDGFTIQLDISVVWGLLPKDVPLIINRFGNAQAVIDKIIRPQLESICRIEGSKYGAKEFIEGTSRELFQKTFTDQLVHEAKIRNIDVLLGLVRDIHVPLELREPIQKAKIAAEEQITKEEQRRTQVVQNELEELKAGVEKGVREVAAETEQKVANLRAEGARKVATIGADKEVGMAEINNKVAQIQADRERILGKAEADVIELMQKADADRFQKMVGAMGDPEAYANYIFATKLPDDLRIHMRYSGPGTFWTDLPPGARMLEDAAARKILEKDQREPKR